MTSEKVRAPTKKTGFTGFFGFLIELCVAAGALLWVAYSYLPHQYYLPIGLTSACLVGIAAYFILNRKVDF